MVFAQRKGWRVVEVYVDGKRLELTAESSWLKELWSPRLVILPDGMVTLRRQPAVFNGRGRHVIEFVDMLGGGGSHGSDSSRSDVRARWPSFAE
jgi:hypothetical protein